MKSRIIAVAFLALTAATPHSVLSTEHSVLRQTPAEADARSSGCITCHKNIEPMHQSAAVRLGCTDCHGGNAMATTKELAHIQPRHPEIWKTSANPPRTYTALLDESAAFV